MKIAIHSRDESYSVEWIEYCNKHAIDYKIVNCYNNDIIAQLHDCDALMWHFHHALPADILFAKQLLYSVQLMGKVVFPDFDTMWHFDDKVGQKYLLEAAGAPLVNSYVFYSKIDALKWINEVEFPKVFKLRVGASSQNVRLAKTREEAKQLVKRAFSSGFKQYNPWITLKETIRKHGLGETTIWDITKGIVRLFYRNEYEKFSNREKGYVYFQDFVSGNDADTRIIAVDNKVFAIKRLVRKNDFRASGSHMPVYTKELIDTAALKIALDVTGKLKLQCGVYDFVHDNGIPKIVEVSYGTSTFPYKLCPGYWDSELNFHEGEFDFCGWIIDAIVNQVNILQSNK